MAQDWPTPNSPFFRAARAAVVFGLQVFGRSVAQRLAETTAIVRLPIERNTLAAPSSCRFAAQRAMTAPVRPPVFYPDSSRSLFAAPITPVGGSKFIRRRHSELTSTQRPFSVACRRGVRSSARRQPHDRFRRPRRVSIPPTGRLTNCRCPTGHQTDGHRPIDRLADSRARQSIDLRPRSFTVRPLWAIA